MLWWLLACASPEQPPPAETAATLLTQAWTRWSLTEPDPLWEALAESYTGEALTEHYVDTWAALTRMREEHITLEVLRVDVESARALPDGRVEVDWAVGGRVNHRSHTHLRTNRYRARLSLVQTAAGWRIAGEELADARRVRTLLDEDGWLLDDLPGTEAGTLDLLDL